MLATEAAANNAKLVDAYRAGIGHDACKLPTVRWVEPAVPVAAAAPLHPNLDGMQGPRTRRSRGSGRSAEGSAHPPCRG
jgi:hypothetical protein